MGDRAPADHRPNQGSGGPCVDPAGHGRRLPLRRGRVASSTTSQPRCTRCESTVDDHSFLAGGFVNHNTECRLAQLAMLMLDGIDEDTVDFVHNYDGQDREPVVLPARFPNLLVNGSQGDRRRHGHQHPASQPGRDHRRHRAPDRPPGGHARRPDAVRQGPRLPHRRAHHGPPGDHRRLPHRSRHRSGCGPWPRSRKASAATRSSSPRCPTRRAIGATAAKIKDLVESRSIDGIADVNDESAGDKTRLVIRLKKDAPGLVILNNLYKHTPLQTNFAVNMVALVDGVPRTLNLAQALQAYIDHQVDVIRRRSEFRLKQGPGPGPHRRGPPEGARRHRPGHRPDPRRPRTAPPPRTG